MKPLFLLILISVGLDFAIAQSPFESLTEIRLVWTPLSGDDSQVSIAKDEDGPGPGGFSIDNVVSLGESAAYRLTIELGDAINRVDLDSLVRANGENYQMFFGWDEDLFDAPNGDGNLDLSSDPVQYIDFDGSSRPVGLETDWITACVDTDFRSDLRLVLKGYEEKSDTSTIASGTTMFDITFSMQIDDAPDAPPCENEEEIITDVILIWRPVEGGKVIEVRAVDPDGPGPLDLEISSPIELARGTTYQLDIKLLNSISGEDLTEEVNEESDEHQLYFEFSEQIFSDPVGTGNVVSNSGVVNYLDSDENGLPVGLSTKWTTRDDNGMVGTFRIILKHQPDQKAASSDVNTGSTDLDLTWSVGNLVTDASDISLESEILIYPNPASDLLFIDHEGKLTRAFATLYDMYGRVLKHETLYNKIVDISAFKPGYYLIEVEMQGQPMMRKWVIKL